MKTDSLFYRLLQTRPQLLFDLLGTASPIASDYQFQSVELKQTAFRLDGLFIPPSDASAAPLFFVKVQFQPDPEFYHLTPSSTIDASPKSSSTCVSSTRPTRGKPS